MKLVDEKEFTKSLVLAIKQQDKAEIEACIANHLKKVRNSIRR